MLSMLDNGSEEKYGGKYSFEAFFKQICTKMHYLRFIIFPKF